MQELNFLLQRWPALHCSLCAGAVPRSQTFSGISHVSPAHASVN